MSSAALSLAVLLGAVALASRSAEAQTLTVLHSFAGGDGANPEAGLIRDAAGNFYGTTNAGGAHGYGTVFKVGATNSETVLHNFTGADGANPEAGLIRDGEGNLYGTTARGGAHGCGTVFKVDAANNETVLHSFGGYPVDGANPYADLIRDAAGNFYGTTSEGGAGRCGYVEMPRGCGTVFKLDATGTETVLHSFPASYCTPGCSGICFDSKYGDFPSAGLVRDTNGNLYGTTGLGGDLSCRSGQGCGVVFGLNTPLLHSFDGADGELPNGLIGDAAGNLYGTTDAGGASGFGTVFKLDPTDSETVLHSFTGGADGKFPHAVLVRDAAGNLYGTTSSGGAHGYGTVFKLTP